MGIRIRVKPFKRLYKLCNKSSKPKRCYLDSINKPTNSKFPP